jgi:hypothetical protein
MRAPFACLFLLALLGLGAAAPADAHRSRRPRVAAAHAL